MTESSSRADRRWRGVYPWVAAGAVAFGLGVALVDGVAVASADADSSATGASAARPAATAGPARERGATSARKAHARPSSAVTASGGAVTSEPAAASASIATSGRSGDVSSRVVGIERAAATAASRQISVPTAASDDVGAVPVSAATPAADANLTPLQSLARQLQYIFFNKTPTVEVDDQVQNPGGTVNGTLTGQSNNGFALTYSLGRKPEYGSVVVDATTGAYIYTPDGTAPATTAIDGFSIIADNGTAARLPGLLGVAQSLMHALAVGLGVSAKDTDESDIAVSLTGQTIIGNPAGKVQYWEAENIQTAALTAVAMVIGQLTGTMPTLDELKTEAMNTLSVAKTTKNPQTGQPTTEPAPMYTGGKDWVWNADGNQLLWNHGVVVTGSYYSKSGGLAAAQENLATALEEGKSVIVYPKTDGVYVGYKGVYKFTHAVTVLGLNFTKQVVYINDGALPDGGQNMAMSFDDFVDVWGPIYETAVAELPPTA